MRAFATNKNSNGRKHRMFSMIRKRLTFANVAMTLALVFAMTGGAYRRQEIPDHQHQTDQARSVLKAAEGQERHERHQRCPRPERQRRRQRHERQRWSGHAGSARRPGSAGRNRPSRPERHERHERHERSDRLDGRDRLPLARRRHPPPSSAAGCPCTETGAWAVFGAAFGGPAGAVVALSFPIPLATELGEGSVHYIGNVSAASGTGDTESGEQTIKNAVATTGKFEANQYLAGSGIASGTWITEVSGSELKLSHNATATATGVALTATRCRPAAAAPAAPPRNRRPTRGISACMPALKSDRPEENTPSTHSPAPRAHRAAAPR